MPISNAQMRDLETLVHPYTDLATLRERGPTILERGEGVHVFDSEGRKYLEGMGGLWCTALGYGHPEMAEAAREQLSRLPFAHLFAGKTHDGAIALGEKIKELSPAPTSKVFFTCSGSEANDTQIKIAWYYNNARGLPEKKKFISRMKAYHGVTMASASLTGLPNNHASFDLPLPWVRFAECPHHYHFAEPGESEVEFSARLAGSLDALIEREGPDTIAAFIAEPVMGAGGVIVPPEGYFEAVQAVLDKHDILFIADEVICGFGRLGEWFGSQHYGIRPDTVTMAKALTSGYAPLGAVTISQPVSDALEEESRRIGFFGHGFTYSGHPLSTALGLKAIEIYERDDILGRVRTLVPGFQKRLRTFSDHPLVGEARGVGLVGGLELVAEKAAKRSFDPKLLVGLKAAGLIQDEGVILRAIGDMLAVCPPLVITEAQLDELFEGLRRGLDRAEEMVRRDGLRG